MPLESAVWAERLAEIRWRARRHWLPLRSSKKTDCWHVRSRLAENLKSAAKKGKNNVKWLAKFAVWVECARLNWSRIPRRANPQPMKQKSSHSIVTRMD